MQISTYTNLLQNQITLDKKSVLGLKLGELLTARVLKANAELALLEMKGQRVLAEVKAHLQPGEEVRVRVTGEQQNRILLKILTTSDSTVNSLDQLLQKIGIQPDKDSRNALDFLLKNNLPVTANTLKALITDQKSPLIQILQKIFAQQSPIQIPNQANQSTQNGQSDPLINQSLSQNLTSRQSSEANQQPTGSQLITQENTPMQHSVPRQHIGNQSEHGSTQQPIESRTGQDSGNTQRTDSASSPVAAEQNPSIARPTTVTTDQTSVSANSPQGTDTSSLADTTNNSQSPIPTEGQNNTANIDQSEIIRDLISPKSTSTSQTNIRGDAESAEGTSMQRTLNNLVQSNLQQEAAELSTLKKTLTNIFTSHESKQNQAQSIPEQNLATQLEKLGLILNPERSTSEIVRSIKSLIENLGLNNPDSEEPTESRDKPSLPFANTPLSEEQKDGVRELLDKFLGIRLRQKADDILLHLEIPLIFNQPGTAVLQIREDHAHTQREPDQRPLNILFNLDIESLGKLKILILLSGKEMNCHFSAQEEKTRLLLRKHMPELKEKLEEMSFSVSILGVSTLLQEEDPDSSILPGQIDFRV